LEDYLEPYLDLDKGVVIMLFASLDEGYVRIVMCYLQLAGF